MVTIEAVILGLVSIIVSIIGWNMKRIWTKIDELDTDLKNIKGNYLNRFSEAKDHTTNKVAEVIERINDNKVVNLKEHSAILSAITELKTLMCKGNT
jgi:hypothetical protein